MLISLSSQTGAAGTIRSVWRAKNVSSHSCRSFGYPGMDIRASGHWQNIQVHRGKAHPDISGPPQRVIVKPGEALYFVSYWSDVPDSTGNCKQFDRMKITLPDNFQSAQLSQSGCATTDSVYVGPVTKTPPAP